MTATSVDAAALRRTFAKVAAAASHPTPPSGPSSSDRESPDQTITMAPGTTSTHVAHAHGAPLDRARINPAIPRVLAQRPSTTSRMPTTEVAAVVAPNTLAQPLREHTDAKSPAGLVPSGAADENSTQLPSSGSPAKPPSLDGKSIASATTFAMDEKESIRPDDSASVKAIEDEDSYSPPGSAAVDSRIGSESGARAFSDQLQEITSMGPSTRPSQPPSRPESGTNGNEGLFFDAPPGPQPALASHLPQSSQTKTADFPPDQKLLEALCNPRDRIWVLKLEQDIIDFVKDSKESYVDLPQCNSFYRMLAHKLADYYFLGHAVDNNVSAVRLYKTPSCRIAPPLTGITNPSTASNTPPPAAPQMKILRRDGPQMSKSTSEGDSASDGDKKAPLTREEREQRYEQARLRIMGSAKPEADPPAVKEKDESRSSSTTGKKKPRKQRTNSEDGFDTRSAYNTFANSSYAQTGGSETSVSATYYPAYSDNQGAAYNNSNAYAQPAYGAVYGQAMPSQMNTYPWLQNGYSGNAESNGQAWDQSQQHGGDLASDFRRGMSLQSPNMQGVAPSPSPGGPYGYPNQPQGPPWSQSPAYQQSYPMQPGYAQYPTQDRPMSSASHQSSYGYGMPANRMQAPYMGFGHGDGFHRPSFNPQSQAFVPGYPATSGPQSFAPSMVANHTGYMNPYAQPHPLQRQDSTNSQSSYNGQRSAHDGNNPRRPSGGMTHPLPQPVFSPTLPMPCQNSQRMQHPTPSHSTSGSAPNDKSPQSNSGSSSSTIAKWGTPASLPAKPPPPAHDSFDMSRIHPAAAARLPGMNGSGYHTLPPMVGVRGGANGPSPRGGGSGQ